MQNQAWCVAAMQCMYATRVCAVRSARAYRESATNRMCMYMTTELPCSHHAPPCHAEPRVARCSIPDDFLNML
jgi:hypothetical protein